MEMNFSEEDVRLRMRKSRSSFLLSMPGIYYLAQKAASWQANYKAKRFAGHFNHYLHCRVADSPEMREHVHRIRHNVYCEELGFEPLQPNGMEMDEFDKFARFCAVEHRSTNKFTGCVRLVLPNHDHQQLPIEKYCADAIEQTHLMPSNFPRHKICEISRLAVPAEFRRRKSDKYEGSATGAIDETTYTDAESRCFPFISVGLYLSAAAVGINLGVEHFYVMMEPRLARSMRLVGIPFKQIGPTVEYHGKRAPYYICPKLFLLNLKPGFKMMYQNIEQCVREEMHYQMLMSEFEQKDNNDVSSLFDGEWFKTGAFQPQPASVAGILR